MAFVGPRWWMVFGVLAGACRAAPAPEPLGTTSAAIVEGEAEGADDEVVALVHGDRAECTGTLVAERVVVTAAHCLDAGPPDAVFFGSAVGRSGETRPVLVAVAHPDYAASTLANDLAIVVLGAAAPASV